MCVLSGIFSSGKGKKLVDYVSVEQSGSRIVQVVIYKK